MTTMIECEFESQERKYALWLGRDLLGDLLLVRKWQGKKTKRGGQKIEVIGDEALAAKKVMALVKTRRRHGYMLTYIKNREVLGDLCESHAFGWGGKN